MKAKVIDFWEIKLRGKASLLSSLLNFKPEYMSLTKPHPIWGTAGSNPYMRYLKPFSKQDFCQGGIDPTNWAPKNKEGHCSSPTCDQLKETVEHILLDCQAYNEQKRRLYPLWLSTKTPNYLSGSSRSIFK